VSEHAGGKKEKGNRGGKPYGTQSWRYLNGRREESVMLYLKGKNRVSEIKRGLCQKQKSFTNEVRQRETPLHERQLGTGKNGQDLPPILPRRGGKKEVEGQKSLTPVSYQKKGV